MKLFYILPWSLSAAVLHVLHPVLVPLLIFSASFDNLRKSRGPSGNNSDTRGDEIAVGF